MPDLPIVICYDGSDTAKEAIRQTADLHPGADVVVVTAWSSLESLAYSWISMAGNVSDIEIEAEAHTTAEEGAALATEAGLRAHAEAVQANGSVGRTLVGWIMATPCKLVATGAVGHWAFADVVSGSVANVLTHHSPVPVLLVRLPHPATRFTPSAEDDRIAIELAP